MLEFLRARSDEMLSDLRWLVEHESPSGDKRALDALADRIAVWAADLKGLRVTSIPSPAGNHLRLESGSASDGKRPLLLFHFDTVWPIGTLEEMPFRADNGRASGPGVFDMKAGIAQGIWALHALRSIRGDVPPLVCLLTSDEETGSATSRELIESLATTASAALVLEPSQGGALKTSRKGVGLFRLEVNGVPAHAGVDPRAGASAIVELARLVLDLESENKEGQETTVNVGVVSGGTRPNVVAEAAVAQIDLRVATAAEAERMCEHILQLRPHDSRTRIRVSGGMNRPPMERTFETGQLLELARTLAGDLGLELKETSTGGGSDGNFCAAAGVPVLDGLGAVGDGAHARSEHIVISEMPRRAALVAHLVQGLAQH